MKAITRILSLLLCLFVLASSASAESVRTSAVSRDEAEPTLTAVLPTPDAAEPTPDASESTAAAESSAEPEKAAWPVFETEVTWILSLGDLYLTTKASDLLEAGYEYGDLLAVTIHGETLQMPLVTDHSDVDDGVAICIAEYDKEADKDSVSIAINLGDLATTVGVARRVTIKQDPGYRWDYLVKAPIPVTISMKEKGGYAAKYYSHHLIRSDQRNAYPHLTDEEYANFRCVGTTGMGERILYRSSNPVNPELKRNREADKALHKAGVRTVMNLADSETSMRRFKGYASSFYHLRKIVALHLPTDLRSDVFKAGLAKGMEFFAANKGPYLVHCREGKDRCGFVCAVLESLMGATADEIVADYMLTFYNYYGVEPGTEQYDAIAHGNIEKNLAGAFGIEDIHTVDLAECAENYLRSIGLSDETITALKTNLSASR